MEIGGGNGKLTGAVRRHRWALEPTYTKYYAMPNGAGWLRVEAAVGGGRRLQDTFKEARKGDIANQVLVAQMFFSGYGTPKNEYKV